MKAILAIAAATVLVGPAWGQSYGTVTVTPQNSTGPTVPPTTTDTRQVDQSLAPLSTAPNTMSNPNENWRTSSGFNNDPSNPSGAPGSGPVGTSPTR